MKENKNNCGDCCNECSLKNDERQPCEVWTRVMGYYRPVSEFNSGKKSEQAERVHFSEEKSCGPSSECKSCCQSSENKPCCPSSKDKS